MKWLFQLLMVSALGLAGIATVSYVAPAEAARAAQEAVRDASVSYQNTRLSICVTILLLIPTYWAFLLQRRTGPGTLWRAFWTVAWLTFIVHLYWAMRVIMTFDTEGNPTAVPEEISWTPGNMVARLFETRLVSAPRFDIAVFLWWTFDVMLSWVPQLNGIATEPAVKFGAAKRIDLEPAGGSWFVRFQRSAISVLLAVAMLVAAVPQGHGAVRLIGLLFGMSTACAIVARIVRRPFYPESVSGKLFIYGFALLNKCFVWHRLPKWIALFNLAALREQLRANNLHGTESIPVTNPCGVAPAPTAAPSDLYVRRSDGWFNDSKVPAMGSGSETTDPSCDPMIHDRSNPYARFGRNVPLDKAKCDTKTLFTPSPRVISEKLLARKKMIEAPTLNLLAAAWIQFQTHDWFNHGEPVEEGSHRVPLPEDDSWRDPVTGKAEMTVRATRPDPTRPDLRPTDDLPRTFVNAESHWWDASQIYGSSSKQEALLRSNQDGKLVPDGKLGLDENGEIPFDLGSPNGIALSGFVGNWWAGLSLLHDVFVKEHNAICDMLRSRNANWDDNRVFATAKMINGALMAKIHTVEWTPALLQHPSLQSGMSANWWGLATEGVTRTLGRIGPTEAFGGIPNSGVDHHGTPFTLTEEFVSVYRLHPLLPDSITVKKLDDEQFSQICATDTDAVGTESELRKRILKHGRINIWYSFGLQSPGALTLHNYPNFLRRLTRTTVGKTVDSVAGKRDMQVEAIDLATIDILRDRERGVPRYNEFRRLFHMRPIRSFDEFGSNPYHDDLPRQLREVYGQTDGVDNVELLDVMIGMFAETPPTGFGISDTAFRVFILMASRRLKSDRFIADAFGEEVFTKDGVSWVNDNSMVSVLVRHFPGLSGPLYGVGNAFVPWSCRDHRQTS